MATVTAPKINVVFDVAQMKGVDGSRCICLIGDFDVNLESE